jgi:hemoglobin
MRDIASREDVEVLVKEFYKKVRRDKALDYIFDEVVKIDWEHHIPILVDFWESILLNTNKYNRNTMAVHFEINQKVKLEPVHFASWLSLFDSTVDEYFEGEKALMAKTRAHAIAQIMETKMQAANRS